MVVGSADSSGQPRVQLGESFVWREAVGMGSVVTGHPVFLQERPNLATIAETSAIEGVQYIVKRQLELVGSRRAQYWERERSVKEVGIIVTDGNMPPMG